MYNFNQQHSFEDTLSQVTSSIIFLLSGIICSSLFPPAQINLPRGVLNIALDHTSLFHIHHCAHNTYYICFIFMLN